MQFTCDKEQLLETITKVFHSVSGKTTIPVLEGILLECAERITMTGFNSETGIRSSIDVEARVYGSTVVNAKLMSDLVRKMPNTSIAVEKNDSNIVTFRGGMTEFTLIGMNPEEFPRLPEVGDDTTLQIPQRLFKDIIGQVQHAISTKEDQKVYTGALFEIEDKITVAALDGARMAVRIDGIDRPENAENLRFIVPGAALRELEKIVGETEEIMTVGLSDKHIQFEMGNTILISRLIDGEFMNYRNVIPKASSIMIRVDKRELVESLERVSLIISEKIKTPVKLVFDGNNLRLYCETAVGRASDELTVESSGGVLTVGFNSRLLLDALRAADDDEIIMELGREVSPCVIHPVEGDKYYFVVLPVRLKNG